LCAGSVSARQLQTKPKLFPACTGTCSATRPCLGGCICQDFGGTTKACVRDPGTSQAEDTYWNRSITERRTTVSKKIKPTLLAVIVTAVLFAGTVSARQLHKSAALIGVCNGRCSATQPCSGACSCVHINGASLGSCVSDPP
jgi:hypothetical protein